jgi:hypothetical protein
MEASMRLTAFRFTTIVAIVFVLLCQNGFSQNLGNDARRLALGGAGATGTVTSEMIGKQQDYTAIPIPLGLIQVFKNREIFDPSDPDFDPVRAVEYAADPLHLTMSRNSNAQQNLFIKNLVDAGLNINRDLNTYRGFKPAQHVHAQGLVAASWGKTFRVGSDDGISNGIYLGAGPYLAIGTDLDFDRKLIDVFSSTTNLYHPNNTYVIGDITNGQAALAITGGYRGRFRVKGLENTGKGEGVYVSANYNYLHGIHYENGDVALQLDTDSSGLLIVTPSSVPLAVNRISSSKGHGFSIDLATGVVKGPWTVGVGLDGLGNRINWSGATGHRYALQNLFNGGDFVTSSLTLPSTTIRATLPVRFHGNTEYTRGRWTAVTELGKGFHGFDFNGGVEYRFGPLAFRGGTRYNRHLLHGSTGLGFNILPKIGIDFAAFQSTTNLENDHRLSYALSLRINHSQR